MSNYIDAIELDYGVVTDTKCVECGDLLAEWENTLCCICEAMQD